MAKCNIQATMVSSLCGGTGKEVHQCTTHMITEFLLFTSPEGGNGEAFCPLGRIEHAVEDGLAKLATAAKAA